MVQVGLRLTHIKAQRNTQSIVCAMSAILAQCSHAFSSHHSYVIALFLGGLTGGFTHCLTMCGAFSACRSACAGAACGSAPLRLERRLNLAHHIGRMSSYGMLGAIAALLSRQLATLSHWPKLEASLLLLAGLMFLLSSLASPWRRHAALEVSGTYLRGFLLGFMPCGLIYAALMVAASTANPIAGGVGMVAFVAGTLPALWIADSAAAWLSQRWRAPMARVGQVAMACNGVVLITAAGNLVM